MSLEVQLNEGLKNLGVTKFVKDSASLQLIFNNQSVVIFDILPQFLKTIESLKFAARKEKIGSVTINKVAIVLQNTPEYLTILRNSNRKTTATNSSYNTSEGEHDKDQESSETSRESRVDSSTELDPYIQNGDYVERVMETAKKTIKQEDSLVRLLIYVGLTAYSHNPLSIGIRAPTSEGKTYAVTQSVQKFFPNQDVMTLGSMSPKALIRQHGIFVDENNQPLEDRIKELKKRLMMSQHTKNIENIIDAQDKLDKLYQKGKWLIDLQGKILLFLEPPHPELWNILKPILSHDAWDIQHPYVDTDLKTKNIVTRGWPVCIFCSAKDESRWEVWPEIQSRFLITSPNMSHAKYLESNILTFQKTGLPNFVQQIVVVSDFEVDLARKCIKYLRQRIKASCPTKDSAGEVKPLNPVWIPYQQYLAESLPSNKGPSMRTASHIGSLLDIIALTKSEFYVDFGIEKQIVARPEDLAEVLRISKDMTSGNYAGLPQHKIRFLKEIFHPLYYAKTEPGEQDGKIEKIIAVTTKELCDYYRSKIGKGITTDNLKKQYLNELLSDDIIGESLSEIDKRQRLYFPLSENGNSEESKQEK
jgi:hypothetical protein